MSYKPRILCLHGGGVSANIFRMQYRYLLTKLEPYFRLVFVDGPFHSEMHQDLEPVYTGKGPCYRWSRWLAHHSPLESNSAAVEIEHCLTGVMKADEGSGAWVGLIGFSQGAKLAFSILLEDQIRLQHDSLAVGFAGVHWRFGVIMAARAPPYSLSGRTAHSEHYEALGGLPLPYDYNASSFPDRLRVPTLHVHGLRDGGLEGHRRLLHDFCHARSAELVEWDGAHRIPFRSPDVAAVADGIVRIAKAGGINFRLDCPDHSGEQCEETL